MDENTNTREIQIFMPLSQSLVLPFGWALLVGLTLGKKRHQYSLSLVTTRLKDDQLYSWGSFQRF